MKVEGHLKIGKRKWDLMTPAEHRHYMALDYEVEVNKYLCEEAKKVGPNRISTIGPMWMEGWENRARFVVSIDLDDGRMRWVGKVEGIRYVNNTPQPLPDSAFHTQYIASDGDVIHHLYHTPMNESGFAGRVFDLVMLDGTERKVKGPWSGRASCLREHGYLATECVTETNQSVTCDDAAIIAACKARGMRLAYVRDASGEMWLEPLNEKGEHKKYREGIRHSLVFTEI